MVGRWSWLSRGHGWVVTEVAPVMIFFEWVCSDGFQIGFSDFFFYRRGFVFVFVFVFVVCARG